MGRAPQSERPGRAKAAGQNARPPLLAAIRQFFAERIFGPERAALFAIAIPATATQNAAQRQKKTAALRQ